MGKDEEVRLIAYQIWEAEGCCHGRDIEHWLKAEIVQEEGQKQKVASASEKKMDIYMDLAQMKRPSSQLS